MTKFKRWLCERFLPTYCREELLEVNARLGKALAECRRENERLRSYIRGMETALRHQRRITVRNEVRRE